MPPVFSPAELATFREQGYVRLRGAFDPGLAGRLRAVVWAELEKELGILEHDRSTWTRPAHSPRGAKAHPLAREAAGERFIEAIGELLGESDWRRPANWGGFVLVFPDDSGAVHDVPSDTWHWDGAPRARGLLIFTFYSSVGPGGGGTHVLAGSHHLLERFYASLSPEDRARPHKVHRKLLRRWDPWLTALTLNEPPASPAERLERFLDRGHRVQGVDCRVVELTGEPGDAVFCNLGLLHATAPNLSSEPRFQRVKFLFLEQGASTSPAAQADVARGLPGQARTPIDR